jgi:hypothetical protein
MAPTEPLPASDAMRMEQGLTIPCVDCKVLLGPDPECGHCDGAGELFQPAQMCDDSIQWQRGQEDRARYEEHKRADDGPALAQIIRGCFVSHLIWGPAWVAGFLDDEPDENDPEWPNWDTMKKRWESEAHRLTAEFHQLRSSPSTGAS